MSKRELHHYLKWLKYIKPHYLAVLTAVCLITSLVALRSNNEHMIKLRDAVYTADKNNTDVVTPLKNLQAYVTTHMNTDLSAGPNAVYPPIQLKYTYDRLVLQKSEEVAKGNQTYNDAQHYCEQQNPTDFSGRNRVPCIEQYVTSHGAPKPAPIPDALYKFDFVSPKWSPDLAGWSLVATALFLLLTLFVAVGRWIAL